MLGASFVEVLEQEVPGCRVVAPARTALDIADREAVIALERERPDWILHCAALVNADICEENPAACDRVQLGGAQNVIALARATGARVLYPQSFLIFEGGEAPIVEETVPHPLCHYGNAKLQAERAIQEALPDALVVRMAGFFGGEARDKNFVGKFVRHLFDLARQGKEVVEVGDRIWQPTYTLDLARNALLLASLSRTGIYNMASHGEASFFEIAAHAAQRLGLDRKLRVERVSAQLLSGREKATRPLRAVMENRRLRAEKLDRQRPWRESLDEYLSGPYFRQLS